VLSCTTISATRGHISTKSDRPGTRRGSTRTRARDLALADCVPLSSRQRDAHPPAVPDANEPWQRTALVRAPRGGNRVFPTPPRPRPTSIWLAGIVAPRSRNTHATHEPRSSESDRTRGPFGDSPGLARRQVASGRARVVR
jgi:hypothetical protein